VRSGATKIQQQGQQQAGLLKTIGGSAPRYADKRKRYVDQREHKRIARTGAKQIAFQRKRISGPSQEEAGRRKKICATAQASAQRRKRQTKRK
jgi:hypothetical protein